MRSFGVALVLLSFGCGDVVKTSERGTPDAFEFDSQVAPTCAADETSCGGTCANLQTNALYCGDCTTFCAASQSCEAGKCVTTKFSCARLKELDPALASAMFTNPDTNAQFYCDFTNGAVYEGFGIGSYTVAYSGWTLMSSTQLNNAEIQKAFIAFYNLQGGLLNTSASWDSGNCCLKTADSAAGQMLGIAGAYVYPAKTATDQTQCGGPYADAKYRWYETTSGTYAPATLPANFFTLHPVSLVTNCSDSNNPGIFYRRRANLY